MGDRAGARRTLVRPFLSRGVGSLSRQAPELADAIDGHLPRRQHPFVLGMAGQVRSHANERFEIHALASKAGAASVAPAERSLRGEDGVGFVEAVDSGQTERNIGE